jgi:hypothetical protein
VRNGGAIDSLRSGLRPAPAVRRSALLHPFSDEHRGRTREKSSRAERPGFVRTFFPHVEGASEPGGLQNRDQRGATPRTCSTFGGLAQPRFRAVAQPSRAAAAAGSRLTSRRSPERKPACMIRRRSAVRPRRRRPISTARGVTGARRPLQPAGAGPELAAAAKLLAPASSYRAEPGARPGATARGPRIPSRKEPRFSLSFP